MNIILLLIDTLRYDAVGANSEKSWIETPNLDRLASESWRFTRAFVSSYPTIPFRTDVIAGDFGVPANPWAPLRFDVPTLPRALEELGYVTQLIHDTPHLANGGHAFDYPFHGWSFIRGCEVDRPWIDGSGYKPLANWAADPMFDFIGDAPIVETPDYVIPTYARANRDRWRNEQWNTARLFDGVNRFLRENRSRDRFFLWIDCFDPHEPWDSPPEYVLKYDRTPGYDGRIDPRVFLKEARRAAMEGRSDIAARLRNLYAAKVSWMDRWVGTFLDTLEETGLSANTALIVAGDHGTNVGERGVFGKSFPVHEQEGHIPLFLRAPGLGAGTCDAIVQPQEIHATILALAEGQRTGTATAKTGERGTADTGGVDSGGRRGSAGAGAAKSSGIDLASIIAGTSAGRQVAVSARPAIHWTDDPGKTLLTVFGADSCLTVAADPASCRLMRYGSLEDESASRPDEAAALRNAGIAEVERRGIGEKLTEWLTSGGKSTFPAELPGRRIPEGFRPYWQGNYTRW